MLFCFLLLLLYIKIKNLQSSFLGKVVPGIPALPRRFYGFCPRSVCNKKANRTPTDSCRIAAPFAQAETVSVRLRLAKTWNAAERRLCGILLPFRLPGAFTPKPTQQTEYAGQAGAFRGRRKKTRSQKPAFRKVAIQKKKHGALLQEHRALIHIGFYPYSLKNRPPFRKEKPPSVQRRAFFRRICRNTRLILRRRRKNGA